MKYLTYLAALAAIIVIGSSAYRYITVWEAEQKSAEAAIYRQQAKAMSECEKRGRSYYESIGSYPTLSDGSAADIKIGRACRTDTNNF